MARLTVPVLIDITGETTGTHYIGRFSVKPFLSHSEELKRDRIRRELLGPHPEGASERAILQADLISYLQVALDESPYWWLDSGRGLDLLDDNILGELYKEAVRVSKEEKQLLLDKGAAALKELKE